LTDKNNVERVGMEKMDDTIEDDVEGDKKPSQKKPASLRL
jgi:hypothetical protein